MLFIIQVILVGSLSTLFMDGMVWLRERLFQSKALNYASIGRWVLSWKDGHFTHQNINQSPAQKHEAVWGWSIHYAVGIIWAYLYMMLKNTYSFESLFISTFIFSLVTTFAPFLIMQPALGFGFFASKTPNPLNRIKNSLITHLSFGLGLYLSCRLLLI